jgi:hypothetical protein
MSAPESALVAGTVITGESITVLAVMEMASPRAPKSVTFNIRVSAWQLAAKKHSTGKIKLRSQAALLTSDF